MFLFALSIFLYIHSVVLNIVVLLIFIFTYKNKNKIKFFVTKWAPYDDKSETFPMYAISMVFNTASFIILLILSSSFKTTAIIFICLVCANNIWEIIMFTGYIVFKLSVYKMAVLDKKEIKSEIEESLRFNKNATKCARSLLTKMQKAQIEDMFEPLKLHKGKFSISQAKKVFSIMQNNLMKKNYQYLNLVVREKILKYILKNVDFNNCK